MSNREEVVKSIPIEKIKVIQNTRTDLTDIDTLMTDIRENGLLEPIGVWRGINEYIVAYGHRRFDALKKLGRKELEVGREVNILKQRMSQKDFLVLNLSENLHRIDNSPLELAKGCKQLLELGLNVSEISSRLSIPKTRVETALRLVQKVPKELRKEIGYGMENKKKGKITATTAGKIARIRTKQKNIDGLFKLAKETELSAKDIEFISRTINTGVTLKQALGLKKDYITKAVSLIVNKKIYEKTIKQYENISFNSLVNKMLQGEIKPIKGLFYSYKKENVK